MGTAGLWVFSIGFVAAALSSMFTEPLGAAITADSMFSIKKPKEENWALVGEEEKEEEEKGEEDGRSVSSTGSSSTESEEEGDLNFKSVRVRSVDKLA